MDFEITGYKSLWDERLEDSIVLIDDARNIIGITLKTMGESFNTVDDETLKSAEEKLMKLRPNVRSFNYDTPHYDVLSGECSVGYMFTPFVMLALMENPNLKIVYPEEGLGFGIDSLVISKDAPHPENAHLFLDYLMRPEVAAYVAEYQWYINPNKAAEPLIDPALQGFAALNIPSELLETAEFVMDVGAYESVFQDIWTALKLQ